MSADACGYARAERYDAQAEMDLRRPIFIVEDHAMVAEALARNLEALGFRCLVAQADDVESILSEARHISPGLVMLDLDLGHLDGIELIPGLRAMGFRVLVTTGCTDHSRLCAALSLGALGWVSKSRPFEHLIASAELAMEGRYLMDQALRNDLELRGKERLAADRHFRQRLEMLTPREFEVLEALSEGETAHVIAERMVLSVGTVRSHIRAILSKLGVTTQLAAVAILNRSSGWGGRVLSGRTRG